MRQTIFGIAIALLAIIFALQNPLQQNLQLYFWEINLPLSLLLILTLIVGIIAGMLIMTKPYYAKSKQVAELTKQIATISRTQSTGSGIEKF